MARRMSNGASERFLRKVLGNLRRVTLIVPGENVCMEIVTEKGEGNNEAV